jgi:hypothetical protein
MFHDSPGFGATTRPESAKAHGPKGGLEADRDLLARLLFNGPQDEELVGPSAS